jgi:hypothetical protein
MAEINHSPLARTRRVINPQDPKSPKKSLVDIFQLAATYIHPLTPPFIQQSIQYVPSLPPHTTAQIKILPLSHFLFLNPFRSILQKPHHTPKLKRKKPPKERHSHISPPPKKKTKETNSPAARDYATQTQRQNKRNLLPISRNAVYSHITTKTITPAPRSGRKKKKKKKKTPLKCGDKLL